MTEKILALGFFDGVHLGHAALFRCAVDMAQSLGLRSAAVSFLTHPSALVTGQSVPLLSSPAEREALIARLGIDETVFLPFDLAMRETLWDSFLSQLTEREHVRGYVVGYDFRFGKGGEGSGELLKSWCEERGLLSKIVPPVTLSGVTVSSTHVRSLLEAGNVEEAVRFLGHPYLLSGIAENGLIRWGDARLPLPDGRYCADITLPDGSLLPDEIVECRDRAVLLSPALVTGALSVGFTRRAHMEES